MNHIPIRYSIKIKKTKEMRTKFFLCFYWTEFHINHNHVHTINKAKKDSRWFS